MQCLDCVEISHEIEKRLEVLTGLVRHAALAVGHIDKGSVETQKELAGILMQYHMAKAEIDGLKIALEIHQGNHQANNIGASVRYGNC